MNKVEQALWDAITKEENINAQDEATQCAQVVQEVTIAFSEHVKEVLSDIIQYGQSNKTAEYVYQKRDMKAWYQYWLRNTYK